MSDSLNGLGLPPSGGVWESQNGNEWSAPGPSLTEDALTADTQGAGQREDEVRSSYFHVRWLGEGD